MSEKEYDASHEDSIIYFLNSDKALQAKMRKKLFVWNDYYVKANAEVKYISMII